MTSKSQRVWFITGASQGLGLEIARAALHCGDRVVATSRNTEQAAASIGGDSDQLLVVPMDLGSESGVQSAVDAALAWAGRIDVLVNNAGYGLIGAVEEVSDDEVRAIFEVNVFGLLRVTRAVLPHMRAQRNGHVINLSSMAGLSGNTGYGIYNATKFAVEGLSEALALDAGGLGIRVTVVEPGPFRTNFLGGSIAVASNEIADYAETAGETRAARAPRHGNQPGDPVRAADAIVQVVDAEHPPLHLLLGAIAYERTENKLDALRKDMDTWRAVSDSTDH